METVINCLLKDKTGKSNCVLNQYISMLCCYSEFSSIFDACASNIEQASYSLQVSSSYSNELGFLLCFDCDIDEQLLYDIYSKIDKNNVHCISIFTYCMVYHIYKKRPNKVAGSIVNDYINSDVYTFSYACFNLLDSYIDYTWSLNDLLDFKSIAICCYTSLKSCDDYVYTHENISSPVIDTIFDRFNNYYINELGYKLLKSYCSILDNCIEFNSASGIFTQWFNNSIHYGRLDNDAQSTFYEAVDYVYSRLKLTDAYLYKLDFWLGYSIVDLSKVYSYRIKLTFDTEYSNTIYVYMIANALLRLYCYNPDINYIIQEFNNAVNTPDADSVLVSRDLISHIISVIECYGKDIMSNYDCNSFIKEFSSITGVPNLSI